MALPRLKIGHLESRYPVIQAGMGVRVGNSALAAAAINCGAFGTIASVGLGDIEKSKTDYAAESNRVLIQEIREARNAARNDGPLSVNIMVALSNYAETARAAVDAGVDFIMQLLKQAGLPDGVINMIPGPGGSVGNPVMSNPHLAGVHFTGSTAVFQGMWKTIGNNITNSPTPNRYLYSILSST